MNSFYKKILMEKKAGFGQKAYSFAQKNPRLAWTLGLGGVGAGGGYAEGKLDPHDSVTPGQSALIGGLAGGILGFATGHSIRQVQKVNAEWDDFWNQHGSGSYKKYYSGTGGGSYNYQRARPSSSGPSTQAGKDFQSNLHGFTKKTDAKKYYYGKARQYHSDKTGQGDEAMKEINAAWDDFKASGAFDKLAYLLFKRRAK